MEEPGGLQSMGSHRVGHESGDLAAAAAEVLSWKEKTLRLCVQIWLLFTAVNITLVLILQKTDP